VLDAANCGDAIVDHVVLEQDTVTRHNLALDRVLENGAADDVVVDDASTARPYSVAVVAVELHVDAHPIGASVDQGSVASLAMGYESGHVPFHGDMKNDRRYHLPFLVGNPRRMGWEQRRHLEGRQGESPYVHIPLSESERGAIPCGIGSYLEYPFVTCPKTTCGHVLDAYGAASSLQSRVG